MGKSTVSFELAKALSSRGHRVGLFDADIHGPSLPSLVSAATPSTVAHPSNDGWTVQPVESDGLALMSFGWLGGVWNEHDELDVRGAGDPGALAVQLLHTTAWGELDYLVIDQPPGTGEIPRALAARAHLAGAVVVSTPSTLATGIPYISYHLRGLILGTELRHVLDSIITTGRSGCGEGLVDALSVLDTCTRPCGEHGNIHN